MVSGTTEVSSRPVEAVEAMGDSYSLAILSALSNQTMSVQEVSDSVDVPIATAYRRVEELEDTGLLEEMGKEMNDEGRRVKVYRSRVEEVHVSFREDGPRVELDTKSDARRSIDDAWREIQENSGGEE